VGKADDVQISAVTLGFSLEHPEIASTPFRSTQTLLDYDTVIWDPDWLLEEYSLSSESPFQGLPLLNENDSALIKDEFRRRKREMVDLLSLGGTIIIFLSCTQKIYAYTGKKEHSGSGLSRQTTTIVDYFDLLSAFPVSVKLVEAAGSKMDFRGSEPFGTLWRSQKNSFAYQAYMEQSPGQPQVFVRRTDRPVATVIPVEKGHVVLLPDFEYPEDDDQHGEFEEKLGTDLLEFAAALRGNRAVTQPEWTKNCQLPDETEAAVAVTKADKAVERALRKRESATRALSELEQRKTLFSGTGLALEEQVGSAFEALGAKVERGNEGRADFILTFGERVAVVEVKGLTKSAKESNAAQLEKWVSTYLEEHEVHPKGILVVNAYAETKLWERNKPAFPNQMLKYSEARSHCLLTGVQLLGAVLNAKDKRTASRILKAIFSCDGVFPDYEEPSEFIQMNLGKVRAK
jgi:hypothetical protein